MLARCYTVIVILGQFIWRKIEEEKRFQSFVRFVSNFVMPDTYFCMFWKRLWALKKPQQNKPHSKKKMQASKQTNKPNAQYFNERYQLALFWQEIGMHVFYVINKSCYLFSYWISDQLTLLKRWMEEVTERTTLAAHNSLMHGTKIFKDMPGTRVKIKAEKLVSQLPLL